MQKPSDVNRVLMRRLPRELEELVCRYCDVSILANMCDIVPSVYKQRIIQLINFDMSYYTHETWWKVIEAVYYPQGKISGGSGISVVWFIHDSNWRTNKVEHRIKLGDKIRNLVYYNLYDLRTRMSLRRISFLYTGKNYRTIERERVKENNLYYIGDELWWWLWERGKYIGDIKIIKRDIIYEINPAKN